MSLLSRLSRRVRRDYFCNRYRRVVRDVLHTAPLKQGTLPFMVLSMVQQRDVQSYLVALKSFALFSNPKRVVVVCDPSLQTADRMTLRQHIPHIELCNAEDFTHPDIPRGGTWERLFAISHYSRENYVVQLDADTLTVRPIPEVVEAVRAGHGFVLGDMPCTPLRSLAEARTHALPKLRPGAHIQTISEAELCMVDLPAGSLYIRGCSGFTGFPRSTALRDRMIDFSRKMGGRLGEDWKRWGTEQVTSNYLIANTDGVRALPSPKYGTPDCATKETAFFHFIGTVRFVNDKYATTSRHAIELINNLAAEGRDSTAVPSLSGGTASSPSHVTG